MDTNILKPCDILLYKGKGFQSWLIQWGTKSPYSHVAVVVASEKALTIESNVGHQAGVRAFDLRKIPDDEVDTFRVKPGSLFDSNKVISFLVAHLGAGFDWLGVSWLGVLKVLQLKKQANEFQKEKDYFCSELTYEAFKEAGLDIVPQIGDAETTSPGDIARSPLISKVSN